MIEEPKLPTQERMLSEAEMSELSARLAPVWQALSENLQVSLFENADTTREHGGDLFDGMPDRQVVSLSVLAYQHHLNAFAHEQTYNAFVADLKAKGLSQEDAEAFMENVSMIAGAGIGKEFAALGKALHADHNFAHGDEDE